MSQAGRFQLKDVLDSLKVDTVVGPVYRKNGRYNDGGVNTMDTAIYLLPKGVELAIYVNSGPGSGANQPTYLAPIPKIIRDSIELSF